MAEQFRGQTTDDQLSARHEDAEVPPLAWKVMWDDRYDDRHTTAALLEWRTWGYVFWDAESLEDGGQRTAQEILTSLRDDGEIGSEGRTRIDGGWSVGDWSAYGAAVMSRE
ncbi:hypothetical protein F5Y18DRAFT_175432 [Xylariaceae sp. FL1019]|nr:hypothetical protein F5Y18DRAFT_175432 [Xylariaceae sp. FL1019]